jgi:hypothetical protein
VPERGIKKKPAGQSGGLVGTGLNPRPCSLASYAQLIHRTAETDQDRIVNLRFSGRRGRPFVSQFRNA